MDRFENARDATLAKYRMMQRPKGKLADGLNLAVDGIATLCMGEHRTAELAMPAWMWLRNPTVCCSKPTGCHPVKAWSCHD